MTVRRILKRKGTYAATVLPDARISEIIAALESEDVGALVVSADGERIDGIISERDVVRGLQVLGSDILQKPVKEHMTKNVITCNDSDRVVGIMALMDANQIRHVPVTDNGKLAGIVSMQDIIRLRVEELQSEADAMRSYISGTP